ncbi:hypothetical protein [Microbulbifer spongiae]|uniref:Uncharacterized protein n=1 Tax=Microbulbifer spongiae TaxID=2944933 RepID=A0ABY9E547_9GAMM|nr:hypothetical protein [Microbulbifer sp. MI-G]WKD48129.1 hypothetical protein M8T91_09195 [Microbulbifer sp. MI-G]
MNMERKISQQAKVTRHLWLELRFRRIRGYCEAAFLESADYGLITKVYNFGDSFMGPVTSRVTEPVMKTVEAKNKRSGWISVLGFKEK